MIEKRNRASSRRTLLSGLATSGALVTAGAIPSRAAAASTNEGSGYLVVHVDEFGATPRPHTEYWDATDAERAANTVAIQAALDHVKSNGGGEVVLGPGAYFTDGPVGYETFEDTALGVEIRGAGPFPTMIRSNNNQQPVFRLHTFSNGAANIRNLHMRNLTLAGGKHGLSLHRAAYNRFDNVWFWVCEEWGIQSNRGQQNQFNGCNFAEVGARNEDFGGADSALFISCIKESLNHCNFGEAGGGVVGFYSSLSVVGGTGYGAWYQGNKGHLWAPAGAGTLQELALDPFSGGMFSNVAGHLSLTGLSVGLGICFVAAHSAYSVNIQGCHVTSGDSPSTPRGSGHFEGFINVTVNPVTRLALVATGNFFRVREGDVGYVINEPSTYKGCVLANNVFVEDEVAGVIPPSSTAPSLASTTHNILSNALKSGTAGKILPPP